MNISIILFIIGFLFILFSIILKNKDKILSKIEFVDSIKEKKKGLDKNKLIFSKYYSGINIIKGKNIDINLEKEMILVIGFILILFIMVILKIMFGFGFLVFIGIGTFLIVIMCIGLSFIFQEEIF